MAEDNTKSLDKYIYLGIICGAAGYYAISSINKHICMTLAYGLVGYYAKPLVIKYICIGLASYGSTGIHEYHWNKFWKLDRLNKFRYEQIDNPFDTTEFNEAAYKELNENIKSD